MASCARIDNNRLAAYGYVIQVRKFKAINTGSVGVTFAVDNKTLEKSGFTVSPDKVPMLTGAPTHAALELTVTLQVSMHTVVDLPLVQLPSKSLLLGLLLLPNVAGVYCISRRTA